MIGYFKKLIWERKLSACDREKVRKSGGGFEDNKQSLAKLHRLLDNEVIEYVAMWYLKKRYNRDMVGIMLREFWV